MTEAEKVELKELRGKAIGIRNYLVKQCAISQLGYPLQNAKKALLIADSLLTKIDIMMQREVKDNGISGNEVRQSTQELRPL